MGAALADEGHLPRHLGVEEDESLGAPAAVLCAAEGDDVDAAIDRHLCGSRVECDHGVCKTRAIHVQRQVLFLRHRRNRPDLVMAVNRTDLGCLGNGDGSRLAMMDELGRIACDLGTQILRGHLTVGAIDRGEAELGEEFGRAAFVLDHVGLVVAEGDAAGLGATCKADRVGSSSGADKENGDFTLEDLVEGRLALPVEIAGPIGRRETGCVACQGFGNGRMGAGPVVGREDHDRSSLAAGARHGSRHS